ncbi:MAG: hydroxymethylglutaryl-CoA lyase [Leucobacter sp.]
MSAIRDLGLQEPAPRAGLDDQVELWEVSPRGGLQAERMILDVASRIELIGRLVRAGARIVEAGSFVRPDRVPAMAGSAEVLAGVTDLLARLPVLVPNPRGYDLARAAGANDIAVVLSVTETFSRNNLGASRQTMECEIEAVTRRALTEGVRVRGYLSMVFGDPWEGRVPVSKVVRLTSLMRSWGIREFSFDDTIGVATPGRVVEIIRALTDAGIPHTELALHLHDAYGQALVNVYASLEAGIRRFGAPAAGIGGCPFARSANGNLATDDLVWLLNGLGLDSGIDLDALAETSAWISDTLLRPASSRVATPLRPRAPEAPSRDDVPRWLHKVPILPTGY